MSADYKKQQQKRQVTNATNNKQQIPKVLNYIFRAQL